MTSTITAADMPPPGELQLELRPVVRRSFQDVYGKADEPAVEPELLPYQVRQSALAPAVGNGTISLGVGRGPVAKSSHGAVYRVTGATEDREAVEVLAEQLVCWLNDRGMAERSPIKIEKPELYQSARIVLTPTGRREGFLAP